MNYEDSEIYDIGTFSISNKKSKIKVVGTVEKNKNNIKPAYWIYFDSKEDKGSISFALKSLEIRALTYALKNSFTSKQSYRKNTGGVTTHKFMEITPEENNSINFKAIHQKTNLWFALDYYETLSFCDEILHLCEAVSNASYLLQQTVAKKKRELAKKNKIKD